MKVILLTGIKGLLGQILYQGLKNDYKIHGLDKNDVDISDFAALKKFFKKLPNLDAILHFAADPYPFASWERVLKNNIEGTKNIYECARLFKVPKVVFASSTHVIGKYPDYPKITAPTLSPYDPVRPDEFYGLSKAIGELIGRTYSDLFNINSINLRIGHTTATTKPDPNLDKIELFEEDLIDIVRKSIEAKIKFGIYFAVSDIPYRFLDLSNAKKDLRYYPKRRTN